MSSHNYVPTAYKDIDENDYAARRRARDTVVRESWVNVMKMQFIREKLDRCYHVEGVNRLENCKEIADLYWAMLRDPEYKPRGFLLIEKVDWS